MRMSDERQNYYYNTDVYADVDTSSSATHFSSDVDEFSLETIQEKLGLFTETEAPADVSTADTGVMPSSQTLNMSYQRDYKSDVTTAKRLSTKTKVSIVCYVAVVLLLIMGIALASVSVTGVFAETVKLNEDYSAVVGEVKTLDKQLATQDFDALAEKAAELGYIDATQASTQTYTEVETRPAQNFNIKTNWFDSLCDWVCGVFGG